MDMKPITPESPSTMLRKTRSLLKPVKPPFSDTASPLMMNSITMTTSIETTSSGDNDSHSHGDSIDQLLPGTKSHDSPGRDEIHLSRSSSSSISKAHQIMKKKRASSAAKNGVTSMSSKISKALFRGERRMFQGNFSKMDSVATDDHGSKFRRSARSSFNVVEPRSGSQSKPAMDFEPLPYDERGEASFDNTSTESHRQSSPEKPPDLFSHNISGLSLGSTSERSSSQRHASRVTYPHNLSTVGSGVSEKTSSTLNYSASMGSLDQQHQSLQSSLRGTKALFSYEKEDDSSTMRTACEVVRKPSAFSPPADDADSSITDLVKERLLDRLDQVANKIPTRQSSDAYPGYVISNTQRDLNASNVSTSNNSANLNASTNSASSKKIAPLKPPPTLPPKAPRKAFMEAYIEAIEHKQGQDPPQVGFKESDEPSVQSVQRPDDSFATNDDDGANDDPPGTSTTSDLPIKLLERLEAAKREDDRLMAEHHDQDPPLSLPMTTDTSFGSSTIASTTSIAVRNRHRVVSNTSAISYSSLRRSSAACSQASKSTAQVTNVRMQTLDPIASNSPYAQFLMDVGDAESGRCNQESQSKSSVFSEAMSTTSLMDNEADEEDVIVDQPALNANADTTPTNETNSNILECKGAADAEDHSKLCYLYSQDGEFENSILSPTGQSVHSAPIGDGGASTMSGHSRCQSLPAHGPRLMYRSDAINSFWDQAQCPQETNLNCIPDENSCVASSVGSTWTRSRTAPSSGATAFSAATGNDDDATEAGSIVPDEILNIVTGGCTGPPDPAAKEALNERLVALEAGWSGFRSHVNERMSDFEESWKSWNLNSLLRFSSPLSTKKETTASYATGQAESNNSATEQLETAVKREDDENVNATPTRESCDASRAPSMMATSTVITTPPSLMSTSDKLPSLNSDKLPSLNSEKPVAETPNNHAAAVNRSMSSQQNQVVHLEVECQLEEEVEALDAMIEALEVKNKSNSSPMDTTPEVESVAESVVMSIVKELERSRSRGSIASQSQPSVSARSQSTAAPASTITSCIHTPSLDLFAEAARQEAENEDVELKIMIGSTEHEIPLSLKNTLAEISMIADANGNVESLPCPKALESSREDSEGGRVILDAADWDPVMNSSTDESIYGQAAAKASIAAAEYRHRHQSGTLPPFADANDTSSSSSKRHGRFFFRRRKNSDSGKKKKLSQQSPTSVMAEI
eukprot:Sro13_g010180.2  (1208) ;mRNA; r:144687-148407